MKTKEQSRIKSILAISTLFACTAGALVAQPPHPPHRGGLPLDLDGDGTVTEVEVLTFGQDQVDRMQERLFGHYDANEDGVITEEEYTAAHEAQLEVWMERVLARLNGQELPKPEEGDEIDRPQRGPRPDRDRTALDLNEDGTITEEEVLTVAADRLAQMAERLLTRFDVNEDGAITVEEALSVHEELVADRIANILERNEHGTRDEAQGRPVSGPRHSHGPRGGGPRR